MSEPAPPEGTARPVPDLGFFAAPVKGGGGSFGTGGSSTFGGGGNQFGGAPGGQFGGGNQFGGAPVGQFGGTPSPAGAFGGSAAQGYPAATTSAGSGSTVKAVVAVVAVLVLVASVVGGRFAWKQFVSDPVLPATLQGLPRVTDPSMEAATLAAQESATRDLTAGSEAKVALYTDGQGLAYILFAVRGSFRADSDTEDVPGTTASRHGKVECVQMAASGESATLCMRGFFRRGVIVMAVGAVTPDAASVATATDEAWRAQ